MNDVLGDEADLALCEHCNKGIELDATASFVECEACSGILCRKGCWQEHWCGPLTDRNGRVVRLGNLMRHHDSVTFHVKDPIMYRVIDMTESFRKHALAVGVNVKGKTPQRVPLHVRLMEIMDE